MKLSSGRCVLLSASILLLANWSVAQQVEWVQALPVTWPAASDRHAMAYDTTRKTTVLFGGRSRLTLGETWEWDGRTWSRAISSSAPTPRFDHAMAYDPGSQRILLFGGAGSTGQLNDTWDWDGKVWRQMHPSTSPPARSRSALAYDSARQVMVLYGGLSRSSTPMNDTWEWNGKNWNRRTPSVSPGTRIEFAMVYDSVRKKTVLFGGSFLGKHLNDTWQWDGRNWSQALSPTSPSPRIGHAMVFDSTRLVTILFGGKGATVNSETWVWDGRGWIPLVSLKSSPPARAEHSMVFDASQRRTLLFGGSTPAGNLADTWALRSKAPRNPGSFAAFGTGCGPRPGVTLGAASLSVPTIGQNFLMDSTNLPAPSTSAIMSIGSSRSRIGPFPLPLNLSSLGMAGCWLYSSFEVLWLFSVKNGGGQFALPIPNDHRIIRAMVFAQSMVLAPGANTAGLLASNGGQLLIGN